MTLHADSESVNHNSTLIEGWQELTPEIVEKLSFLYFVWFHHLTEIRERMSALRTVRRTGWKPDDSLAMSLTNINSRDTWYAHHDMETARYVLSQAEKSYEAWAVAQ